MISIVLASVIVGSTIAGLLFISFAIATIRAILGHEVKPFDPETDVAYYEAQAAKEGWLHRCLVAFDIACNVIILRGQQDETISTHSWRAAQLGKLWGKLMCKWLNGFQSDHGWKAASGDLERAAARVAVLRKALGV